jgi:Ca2+-dependent lipid-binding protein
VVLLFDGQKDRTKIVRRNLNPTWKESFTFKVFHNSPKFLEISVFDWDQFGGHDSLGRKIPILFKCQGNATVDFGTLKDDDRRDLW